MIRIYGIFLFAFLLNYHSTHAQGAGDGNDTDQQVAAYMQKTMVTPPSAEASSLGKYGEYEINTYTGSPNISIPVHTFSASKIPASLALSYNASGIRVADAPTYVGSGFSLTGIPMVSKSVVGKPDFEDNYYSQADVIYEKLFQPTSVDPEEIDFLYAAARGDIETQPDQYHYTLLDRSGKFYISPFGTIIQKEYNDINIVITWGANHIIDEFTITDEYGREYIFDVIEQTEIEFDEVTGDDLYLTSPSTSSTIYNSAWYASSVKTVGEHERFEFIYETQSEDKTVPVNYDQYTSINYKCCDSQNSCPATTTVYGGPSTTTLIKYKKYPKKITCFFSNTKTEQLDFFYNDVTFDNCYYYEGDRYLNFITLQKKSSIGLITYDFSYDCGTGRLSLTEFQEKEHAGTESKGSYQFEYKLPALPDFNSPAVDHWGFHNINLGGSLTPAYDFNTGIINTTNRNTHPQRVKAGSLSSIIYPTGGKTEFVFEAHTETMVTNVNECTPILNNNGQVISHESCDASYLNCCNPTLGDPEVSESFETLFIDQNMIDNGYLEIEATYVDCSNYGQQQFYQGGGTSTSAVTNDVFFEIQFLSEDEQTDYGTYTASAGLGEYYTGKIKFEDHYTLSSEGYYKVRMWGFSTRLYVEWQEMSNTSNSSTSLVGGLRIKEMTTYEDANDNTSQVLQKVYSYNLPGTNNSSGVVFSKPEYLNLTSYVQCFIPTWGGGNPAIPDDVCGTVSVLSNNKSELGAVQGSHIGYSRVEETTILDFNTPSTTNGKTVFHYTNEPFSKTIMDPVFNGKLMKKEVYDDAGKRVFEHNLSYSTDDNSYLADSVFYGYAVTPSSNQDNKVYFYYDPSEMAYIFDSNPDVPVTNYQIVKTKLQRSSFKKHQENRVYKSGETETYFYYDQFNFLTSSVSTEKTYSYDSGNHMQMTKSSITNSDGVVYYDKYYYPEDYLNYLDGDIDDPQVKTVWETNNRILPSWKTEKYAGDPALGNIIDGNKIIYSVTNNNSLEFTRPSKNYRREITWLNSTKKDDGWQLQHSILDYWANTFNPKTVLIDGWNDSHSYVYSTTGKLLNHTFDGFTSSYNYDPNSDLLIQTTNINGTVNNYTYDGLLRLESMTDQCRSVTIEYDYHYKDQTLNGIGGSQNKNFIKTTTTFPIIAGSQLDELEQYQYMDGIGRPIQTVRKNQSESATADLISSVIYDNVGRQWKAYEQREASGNNGLYLSNYGTEYTETLYESSPLSRQISVTLPSWHMTTYSYSSNAELGLNSPSDPIWNCTSVEDPNGNITVSCQDKLGNSTYSSVRNQTQTQMLDTWSYYDLKQRLIQVTPPKGGGFKFTYDYYGNDLLLRKKIKDQDTIRYGYDDRDLLVRMQDGKLKNETRNWVLEYDQYGRPLLEGYSKVPFIYGNKINATVATTMKELSYGSNPNDLDQIVYQKNTFFASQDSIEKSFMYDPCGRMISSNTMVSLDDFAALNATMSYDGSDNMLVNSQDIAGNHVIVDSLTYDHVGRIEEAYHRRDGGITQQVNVTTYTPKEQVLQLDLGNGLQQLDYDYLPNQFLKTINDVNSPNDLYYQELYYDDSPGVGLGWTDRKNGDISAMVWKAETDIQDKFYSYEYDYANRLTQAEFHFVVPNSSTYFSASQDNYSTNYSYDKQGNILTLQRRISTSPTSSELMDNLQYNYYGLSNKIGTIYETANPSGDEKGYPGSSAIYQYDINGNLTYDPAWLATISLNTKNLPDSIIIDTGEKLFYKYCSDGILHRKVVVNEQGDTTSIRDYIGTVEMENSLLDIVHFSNGYLARNENIARGDTLVLVGDQDHDDVFCADVIISDQHIFDNSIVEYLAQDCIDLQPTFEAELGTDFWAVVDTLGCTEQKEWEYNYTIKDHLGNVRVIFNDHNDDGVADFVEKNAYYPFGLTFANEDKGTGDFDYRYNGKEEQEYLGWMNYGARFYDQSIGRFMSIDRFTEKYVSITPYQYAANNPINLVDVNGDSLKVSFDNYLAKYSFERLVNRNLGDQFQVNISENGIMTFDPTKSGGDFSKMSRSGQAFYNKTKKVMNSSKMVNIRATFANSEVHTGDFYSSAIDMADILQFNEDSNELGGTQLGKLTHEIVEQGEKQLHDSKFAGAHSTAISAENTVNNSFRTDSREYLRGGAIQNYTRGDRKVSTYIKISKQGGISNFFMNVNRKIIDVKNN